MKTLFVHIAYIVCTIIVHYTRHLQVGNLLGVKQLSLYTVFPWLHMSKVFWVTLKLAVYVVNILLCFLLVFLSVSVCTYVCCTFANVFTYLLFPFYLSSGWLRSTSAYAVRPLLQREWSYNQVEFVVGNPLRPLCFKCFFGYKIVAICKLWNNHHIKLQISRLSHEAK